MALSPAQEARRKLVEGSLAELLNAYLSAANYLPDTLPPEVRKRINSASSTAQKIVYPNGVPSAAKV